MPGIALWARSLGSLVVAAAVIGVRPAGAQTLMAQALAAHSDHLLLGNLTGFGLVSGARLGQSPISLRFGLSRLTGSTRRTGIACGGLIAPDRQPELLRDDARTITASVGLSAPVWRHGPATLTLGGGFDLAWVHSDTHGLSTGRKLSAGKTLIGVDLGLETSIVPWRQRPFAVVLGVGVSAFAPLFARDELVDGYEPFEGRSGLRRVWLGIAWYAHSR